MIISFSGIDSAGKTTQINMLMDYCKANKIRCVRLWGKARGTPGVVLLKSIFRRDRNMSQEEKLEHRAEVFANTRKKKLLLFASLLDLWWYFGLYYRIVNLFNKITILDRYVWDSYVEIKTEFTGIEFENGFMWKTVCALAPKPKTSFLFVIPAEESIRRDIQKNDLTVDDIDLKNKKIDLYMQLKSENKWTNVMDGMKTVDELHSQVKNILNI